MEQRGLTIWHSSSYVTVQIIIYTLKMDQNNLGANVRVKIKVVPVIIFFFYHGTKAFQLERRHYAQCWLIHVCVRLGLEENPITLYVLQVQWRCLWQMFLKVDQKLDWTPLF